MTPKLKRLLTRLSEKKALIVSDTQGGCVTYAAYPGGDRRCRPVSWISKDVFREWLAAGIVIAKGKGYEVAPGVIARHAGAGHGAAQRTLQTESVSGEDGVFRPAQMNLNTRSGFRALAQRLDKSGEPFLSACELEAGERFSADWARANYGRSPTQDYMHAGSDRSFSNSAETAAIAAIDSRNRLNTAIAYVGPGLSRAVISICGKDMGLEQMEKAEGWARRSGRTVLKLALQRLAEFYGTTPGARPHQRPDQDASARASL